MKTFDSYKDSGVQWIGEIPSHWEMSRLKYLSEVIPSNVDKHIYPEEIQVRLCNYTDVYYNEKIDSSTPLKNGSCDEHEFQRYHVRKKDVIITKDSESPQDIGVPCLITDQLENVVCGYHLTILRPVNIDGEYLFRFVQTDGTRSYFEVSSNGMTRYGLGKSSIENLFVCSPPLPEQEQIVSFLDEKTSKIDDLIKKKEQKIELLKEYRTSLINRVITKGLNPDVPMKDSGVEWIGEIPSHWDVSKVKYQFDISGGGTPSTEKDEYWEGTIPWVSSKDMKSRYIYDTIDHITPLGLQNSTCSLIEVGSIIIVVRSGILQRTIPIGISKVPLVVNQDQKVLSSRGDVLEEFFYYFVSGNETSLLTDWMKEGTTVESIEMEYLENFPLHFPPLSEQEQIVSYLDGKTGEIDSTIDSEKKKIDLLKEYRQSLISSVITGKIKVVD